jgi:hypothetical protein
LLAFFQIANKFYEADGRVTDVGGADWASVGGVVNAAKNEAMATAQ